MKTVLILGASSDVGMAYINRLKAEQIPEETRIIAHYRTMSPKFEAVVLSAKNLPIEIIQADLQQPKDIANLIGQVAAQYVAPTHILHLAAGKFRHVRLREFDSRLARAEMDIQLFSLVEIFKAFLPVMAKNRYGKVVVMLSAYTIGIPPKFVVDYIICKYALLGLMKAAAAEYSGKGININGISPSMIETKFLDNIDGRIMEMTAAQSPLKRNVFVDEVVAAIEFLMSDSSSYLCGINLNLSGGGR